MDYIIQYSREPLPVVDSVDVAQCFCFKLRPKVWSQHMLNNTQRLKRTLCTNCSFPRIFMQYGYPLYLHFVRIVTRLVLLDHSFRLHDGG